MIKVENIEVWGFEHAIRGMRNPMNSWSKSDSVKCYANRNCPGICKNNSCGLCVTPEVSPSDICEHGHYSASLLGG